MSESPHLPRTLVVRLGSRVLLRIAVGSEPTVLGSGTGADIFLPGKGLEARHVEFRDVGGEVRVRSLGSAKLLRKGAVITGETSLEPGDEVNAGLYTLQVAKEGGDAGVATPTASDGEAEPAEIGHLEMRIGGRSVALYGLHDGAVIGRNVDAWISLDDAAVAPRHADFSRTAEGRVQVRDLGSASGTRVNGTPIRTAVLNAGDEISVGPFTFRLVSEAGGGPSGTQRSLGAWLVLLCALLLLVFAIGWRLRLADRHGVGPSPATAKVAALTAGGGGEPFGGRPRLSPLDAELDSLLTLHCVEPEDADLVAELHSVLDRCLALADLPVAGHDAVVGPSEPEAEPPPSMDRSGAIPVRVKREPPTVGHPPLPPRVRLSGPPSLSVTVGAQVRLDLIVAPEESRSLRFGWEAERGQLRPHRHWCSYVAPRLPGEDRVNVTVRASDGGSLLLSKEIKVEREGAAGVAESAAEAAFWRGYRLVHEARVRDLAAARRELESALESESGLTPLLRRKAVAMIAEIDSIGAVPPESAGTSE